VVRAPYWRTDVTQPDDVAEELARVVGYDKLASLSLSGAIPEPYVDPVRDLRERLRDAAVAAGLQEVITYPLTSAEVLLRVQPPEAMEVHPPMKIQNPLNMEQSVMRTSLRASVLQAVASNLRRERGTVAIFEAARAYMTLQGELPQERELIVGAVAGVRHGRWGEPTSEEADFYDAKGLLEETFERIGASVSFEAAEEYALLKGRTAAIMAKGERSGVIGQVHPQVAAQFEINAPVFLFEVDVEKLLVAVQGTVRHQPMSRFPAVIQDLALLVDASVPAAKVTQAIATSALVTQATLFDVYEGAPLPEGKRSLAYAVHFQSLEKTLTDQDVADARKRIIRRLEHEFGAELRGA
jgi:phenylalanyl-tRNA synthetase beta chain